MQMLIEAVRSIWATCLTANGCSLNPSSLCKWPMSAGCCMIGPCLLCSESFCITATHPSRRVHCYIDGCSPALSLCILRRLTRRQHMRGPWAGNATVFEMEG